MTVQRACIQLASVFGLVVFTGYCIGGYAIDTPVTGYKHPLTSDLATAGKTNVMGQTVIVEIYDVTTLLDQKATTAGPLSVEWTSNFTKPTGGWTATDFAECKLWSSPKGSVPESVHAFKFRNP